MELRVVYEAEVQWVKQARDTLRSAGIHAVIVDNPNPAIAQKAAFTMRYRVAVPAQDHRQAQEILAVSYLASKATVDELHSRLKRQALGVVFAPVVTVLAVRAITGGWPEWIVLPAGASLVLAVGVAAWLQRRSGNS